MNGVRKIDDGRAHRQILHISLGGEDEHVVRREVGLDGAQDVLRVVRVLLVLQHVADPGQLVVERILAVDARLVLPVGGDAELGGVVHLPGADLDFKGDALLVDDGGVQGLIHVGLGGRDIVLEAIGNWLEQIVDNT